MGLRGKVLKKTQSRVKAAMPLKGAHTIGDTTCVGVGGDTSHFLELSKGRINDRHPRSSGLLPHLLEEEDSKCVLPGRCKAGERCGRSALLNASRNYYHPHTLSPVSSHNLR